MKAIVRTSFQAVLLAGALVAPAVALDNPVMVTMHGTSASAASATMFQQGNSVLVNVTAQHGIPANAALTLNDGSCSKPGGVAFALAPFADQQSMTQLTHSLSDIAGKAKSMVVHTTASETSPPLACGDLKS